MALPGRTEISSAGPSLGLLALRLGLGGVFLVAVYFKLFQSAFSTIGHPELSAHPEFSPQSFLEAIQAFKVVSDDRLTLLATFWIPWTELVCGLALILGLWTRAASLILGLLLAFFIALLASTLWRNAAAIDVLQGHLATLSAASPERARVLEQIDHLKNMTCGCFGSYHLICQGAVGWCKVGENSGLLLIAMTLQTMGGGLFGLDALFCRRTAEPEPSPVS